LFGQFTLAAAKYRARRRQSSGRMRRDAGHAHFGSQVIGVLVVQPGADAGAHDFVRAAIARLDPRFSGRGRDRVRDGSGVYWLRPLLTTLVFARENSIKAESAITGNDDAGARCGVESAEGALNPHFLFNSLNSISALTSIDPARARDMCVLLGDFLRTTLRVGEHPLIPFSEELGLLEGFCRLRRCGLERV